MRYVFKVILASIFGVFAALALFFTLSLPAKYVITLSVALIVFPVIFIVRDKEKLLIAAFLLSLPVSMGFKIIERLVSTNSTVKLLFQLYLSDIFLILLILIWFFKVFLNRHNSGHSIWKNKLSIPLLLWIGMCFVSLIPAIDRTATAVGIVQMIRIFSTFLCIFHFVKGQKEIYFILNCLLLALLLQSFLMFAQHATNSVIIRFSGATTGLDIVAQGLRPAGTMGHSSHFAKFCGLILPVAFAYVFFAPRLRSRFFALSIWICGSVALALTISRVGLATWLFSIVMFLVGVVTLRIVAIRQRVPLFIVCILLVSISVGMLYLAGGQQLKDRMTHDTGSTATRMPMYKVAFNVIKAHPLTGVGLKNYTLVHQDYDNTPARISIVLTDSPVHNLFLLYAAEIGIPGLLFFLWFIWRLLRGALRCANHIDAAIDKAIYLGIAIGVISLLLQSITGKGVTDHLIHLSVISIFAACVAKEDLIVKGASAKRVKAIAHKASI